MAEGVAAVEKAEDLAAPTSASRSRSARCWGGSEGFHRLLTFRPSRKARTVREVQALPTRKIAGARLDQSRHLLAQGQYARRSRPAAATRRSIPQCCKGIGRGAEDRKRARSEVSRALRQALARQPLQRPASLRNRGLNAQISLSGINNIPTVHGVVFEVFSPGPLAASAEHPIHHPAIQSRVGLRPRCGIRRR
jgi:hypothetical protein